MSIITDNTVLVHIYSGLESKNKIYEGKRGGRYTKDKTKDGRPYRRYF